MFFTGVYEQFCTKAPAGPGAGPGPGPDGPAQAPGPGFEYFQGPAPGPAYFILGPGLATSPVRPEQS